MSSRDSGIFYTLEVKEFRNTLSPSETELFNECIMRIYRDPRADNIHKSRFRVRPPLVDYIYRDDDFVLVYHWTRVTQPDIALRITVTQATWASDFEQGNIVPRR